MRALIGVLLLFVCGASSADPQYLIQAPRISAQQDTARPLESKQSPASEPRQSTPPLQQGGESAPLTAPKSPTSQAEPSTKPQTDKAAEEATEYWTVLGRRIKITDSLLAVFTLALVVVGWWQGSKLQTTIEVAREEFNSTHRPRLHFRHVQLGAWIEPDKPIKMALAIVNRGDLDGRVIAVDAVCHPVKNGGHLHPDPFMNRIGTRPMEVLSSGVAFKIEVESPSLTLETLYSVNNDTKLLYCYAYAEYADFANPPHIRRISCCRVFRPSGITNDTPKRLKGSFYRPDGWTEYEYED